MPPREDSYPSLSTEDADRARLRWEKQLRAHLNRFKRHPGGATRAAGAVTLTFTLAASGHLVSAAIARSSGEPALDQAALGMMARADPVPSPPEPMIRGGLTFTLPVTFRAKRAGQ